jgi:hypothetical protein
MAASSAWSQPRSTTVSLRSRKNRRTRPPRRGRTGGETPVNPGGDDLRAPEGLGHERFRSTRPQFDVDLRGALADGGEAREEAHGGPREQTTIVTSGSAVGRSSTALRASLTVSRTWSSTSPRAGERPTMTGAARPSL